jgi:hypothetical protein
MLQSGPSITKGATMARRQEQRRTHRRGTDPVYAVEDAATGYYLNIDGDKPRAVRFNQATRAPATPEGRLELGQKLSLAQIAAPYDVVRVDRP